MIARLARGEVGRYSERRRYLRRDGSVAHGMLYAGVVHGSEGEPWLLVVQVEDHTARLKAREEADQLRERLAHVGRLGTLGEMAAGIAHEINQPLTAITNYARACQRMLRAGRSAEPQLVDALDKVSVQAKRAGEVIRKLRSLSRKHDTHREPVNVNELILDVVRLAETEARLRGLNVRLELAEPSCAVVADVVQIQQVVLNLLRNGMEAMDDADGEGDLVLRTAVHAGSEVEVAVTDHGTGVSEELEEQLFQPFFTTKESGMGIGLSICRSIIESHGGRLWFTRNLDRGTTFRFTLPTAVGATHD
jgi:two-component system sensor kinase FixL